MISAIPDNLFNIDMKDLFIEMLDDFSKMCIRDRHTLESKIHPGLYFCGELLDVDGICGGYNLQWAWTSGYIACLLYTSKAASLK